MIETEEEIEKETKDITIDTMTDLAAVTDTTDLEVETEITVENKTTAVTVTTTETNHTATTEITDPAAETEATKTTGTKIRIEIIDHKVETETKRNLKIDLRIVSNLSKKRKITDMEDSTYATQYTSSRMTNTCTYQHTWISRLERPTSEC